MRTELEKRGDTNALRYKDDNKSTQKFETKIQKYKKKKNYLLFYKLYDLFLRYSLKCCDLRTDGHTDLRRTNRYTFK